MSLRPATQIGPYRLEELLGVGGMGEVYRAIDTRLGRTVALKFLLTHVASGPDARRRFQLEARTISSLNHPHICALFDVGEHEGTDYLVMEYVQGETMAARLAKGRFPLHQALRLAIEVAGALDAAHARGIVHRDLKPGNIMLADSGVKLLDFGLAKKLAGTVSTEPGTQTLTQTNTIVGTPQYMAPEQIEGARIDHRADIFAFGAVLYEMITGRKAFEGKNQASLMAAILQREPEPLSLDDFGNARIADLERTMRKSLAKNPEDRWQTARDLRHELEWLASDDYARRSTPATPKSQRWGLGLAVATALAALMMLVLVYSRQSHAPAPPGVVRFSVPLPEGAVLMADPAPNMAISPDGRTLAIAITPPDAPPAIWLRPIDSEVAHRLDGTVGASLPFWSPDNTEIGFFADNQLKRIAVGGGLARVLCSWIVAAGGATWGRSGTIVYSSAATLHAVDSSGSPCRPLTKLDPASESRHAWPQFLPDGRRFLYFAVANDPAKNTAFLASLDNTERHALLVNGTRAAFAPPDNLLFVRDGSLFRQRWDFRRFQPIQTAVVLVGDTVPFATNLNPVFSGSSSFSVSENGVLAYRTSREIRSQLVSYSRAGKRIRSIGPTGPYSQFTLSPDEKNFAFLASVNRREFRIWLMRHDTEVVSRFNFGQATNADPVWAPDSRRIAFSSFEGEDDKSDLFEWIVGEEKPHLLLSDGRSNKPDDWSQDGHILIYRRDNRLVLALSMDPVAKPFQTGDTEFRKDQSQLSPDGKRIAYNSDHAGGRQEIFVANFPSFTGTVQVSADGGVQPLWSNNGDELFYLAPDKNLMSVQVRAGSTFETSAPKAVFRTVLTGASWGSQYAVSKDGRTVYILEPVATRQDAVHVFTQWNTTK